MSQPHILLLGGHGKVALQMTPLFLQRSWRVTSVIRDASQKAEILKLGENKPGKIDVLVESLEDVKSEEQATSILEKVKPNWVVWSAGAGGKGGPSRTYAIDRDSAISFISASLHSPSIRKFLTVSYIGSRTSRAPWWNDNDWSSIQHVNNSVLPDYAKAKLAADLHLAKLTKERLEKDPNFQAICFRPGTLKDDAPTGKVSLGKTRSRGDITRGDVARVGVALLERDDTRGWFDLVQGEEEIGDAVERVVRDGVDCYEGEEEGK